MCLPTHRQSTAAARMADQTPARMVVRVAAHMVDRAAGTAAQEGNAVQVLRKGIEAIRVADIIAAADTAASSSFPNLIGRARRTHIHIRTPIRIHRTHLRTRRLQRPTLHRATCRPGRSGIIAISRTAITRT